MTPALGSFDLAVVGSGICGLAHALAAVRRGLRVVVIERDAQANGVHLIAVQSEDGSLVVGDSHHYAPTPDPFNPTAVDRLILDEFRKVVALPEPVVSERWIGTYASASDQLMLVDRPSDAVRIVVITSGTGASTSFAIGEEVIADLFKTSIDDIRKKP